MDKNSSKEKTILFVGSLGFPFGTANIYRQIQLAEIFRLNGYEICVINRFGFHDKKITEREEIVIHGEYHGIEYIHASFNAYRSNNFLFRNIYKSIGTFFEIGIIIYYRVFKNSSSFVINTVKLKKLKYYYFLSRILKFNLIYDYVEYVDSLGYTRESKINLLPKKFDSNIHKYIQSSIIISRFLKTKLLQNKPEIPNVIIPPTIDYHFIDSVQKIESEKPYFLYCGSIFYIDAIQFILDAYKDSSARENGYTLKMIIRGNAEAIKELHDKIFKSQLEEFISIEGQLPYDKLLGIYKGSSALLIPLSNNIQDIARFPFKICEYIACKSPIITSNCGVIPDYFEEEKTALIAIPESIKSFSEKMNVIIRNPSLAKEIGSNAYSLGRKTFSNEIYADKIQSIMFK